MTGPVTEPTAAKAPPLMGSAAQLEALARILLSMRSALEGVQLSLKDPTPSALRATEAQLHGILDQLDAGFVVVGALQATADMGAALETMVVGPGAAAGSPTEPPPTFGSKKRKAAEAAAGQATTQPGESHA